MSEGSRPALPEDAVVVLPVRNLVLLPGLLIPVSLGRPFSIAAVEEATRHNAPLGVLLQREPGVDTPAPADFHAVGCVASIVRHIQAPDGGHRLVCLGQQRFRVVEFLAGPLFYAARIERLSEPEDRTPAIEARMAQLKEHSAQLLKLLPNPPLEIGAAVHGMVSAPALADFVAGLMDLKPEEKQEILETLDVEARMDKVFAHLARRIETLSVSQEIDRQTQLRMDDQQREFLLREQLKTIQKELGEAGGEAAAIEEASAAIGKAGMPAEVEAHARKELRRLARLSDTASEYALLRTYLEWLTELPWSAASADTIDIAEARRILDEDQCGLAKAKRRILEYLAVKKLNPHGKSPIMCFAGPPGVGKTSLGQSIARATGRKFARVSLGGVHDEAEIRGHRRTYIGALPGSIVQAVHKAGTRNCVIMLDEMDKLGGGVQGDPSAALLEVLDPAQNATFKDHYLGVPFDLSEVMFIATANVLHGIPAPLRDRMEVLHLPGYTEEEKAQIARRFLVARQLPANGLSEATCTLGDEAIRVIIRDYTREAGVRNLEREIARVFRHVAMQIAEGTAEKVDIAVADLAAILGPPRFYNEVAMRTSLPGVATGLAWTSSGGDILFIEASLTPGAGKLVLTGQLGEVMRESVLAALTLVKGYAARHGLGPEIFDKNDLHVHVPAGAIPKDGPSAGVAMFAAIASLLLDRPVRADQAMTGEISLRGLVLPVGGIKEKVLAALQAGIATVLLPARNRRELEEIPEEARQKLDFVWLETVEEALQAALVPPEAEAEAGPERAAARAKEGGTAGTTARAPQGGSEQTPAL